jgi:F-type H+-transporting ATPase subunit epsilon
MYLEIITPEKTLYNNEIKYVQIPGSDGYFGILENHAPLISTLGEGTVKIKEENNEEKFFEIKGGVAEVLKNNIVILAKF